MVQENGTGALPTARATHEPSPSVSAVPVGIPSADTLHEIILAKLRGLFGYAYAHRLAQGVTAEEMAKRADMSTVRFRSLMLAPHSLKLRDIGLLSYGLDFEISFELSPRAQGMETREGGDSEAAPSRSDDSPVPQECAPATPTSPTVSES